MLALKRIFALFISLVMMCSLGFAQGKTTKPSPYLEKLNSKPLLQALWQGGYKKGWQFFKPSSNEVPTNMTSKAELAVRPLFPIIGFNDGNITLFVLKKNEQNQWFVDYTNPNALNKKDWILQSFSLDEYFDPNDNRMSFLFEIEDDKKDMLFEAYRAFLESEYGDKAKENFDPSMHLYFNLSTIREPFFDFVDLRFSPFSMDYKPQEGLSVGLGFSGMKPFHYSTAAISQNLFSTSLKDFDLSAAPMDFNAFLSPAIAQNDDTKLYFLPENHFSPVFELPKGEHFWAVPLSETADYVLVEYQNGLFYAPAHDVKFEE